MGQKTPLKDLCSCAICFFWGLHNKTNTGAKFDEVDGLSLEEVLSYVQPVFAEMVREAWSKFALVCHQAMTQYDLDFGDFSRGIFEDLPVFDKFCTVRYNFMLEMVGCFFTGPDRLSKLNVAQALAHLRSYAVTPVVHRDAGLLDLRLSMASYTSGWARILSTLNEKSVAPSLSELVVSIPDSMFISIPGISFHIKKLQAKSESGSSCAAAVAAPALESPTEAADQGFLKGFATISNMRADVYAKDPEVQKLGPILIRDLCSKLQDACYTFTQLSTQNLMTGASVDTGLGHVYMNPKEPGRVLLKGPCNKIAFNYVGRVTCVPSAGSVNVANAFGVKFFMDGGAASGFGNLSELCIPAWKIPMTPKAATSGAPPFLELSVLEHTFCLEFKYKVGAKDFIEKIAVSLVSLRLPTTFKTTSDEVFMLTRPKTIPRMMAATPTPKVPPAKKAGATR